MISINSVVIFLLVAVLVDRASAQAPDYIAAHESNGAYITDPYDYFAKPPENPHPLFAYAPPPAGGTSLPEVAGRSTPNSREKSPACPK